MARTPAPRRRCSSSSIRSRPRRSEPPFASTGQTSLSSGWSSNTSPRPSSAPSAGRRRCSPLATTSPSARFTRSSCRTGGSVASRPERCAGRGAASAWRTGSATGPDTGSWTPDRRHVDRVLACSTWLARALEEAGIDAEALPLPTPPPSPAFVRAPADHPLFVFVGRLSREKGVASLLRAFARLRDAAPTSELRLVGDGDERASLEELARSLAPR